MEGFKAERQAETISNVWEAAFLKSETFEHSRFDPKEFVDIYGEEKVATDLKYVEELKRKAAEDQNPEGDISKQQATVLEAIVADRLKNGGWFGHSAESYGTSEYDDWVAGVDQIVEFGEGINHMGLAVDVTFSNQLKKKFARIHDELSRGILPTVRYFQSGPYKGQLEVPRVVVGLSHENLEKLARMWINPTQDDRLRVHPFRRLLTEQIGLQLRKYHAFTAEREQERISRVLEITRHTFETEVKVAGVADEGWQADKVNQAIRSHMQLFDNRGRR